MNVGGRIQRAANLRAALFAWLVLGTIMLEQALGMKAQALHPLLSVLPFMFHAASTYRQAARGETWADISIMYARSGRQHPVQRQAT